MAQHTIGLSLRVRIGGGWSLVFPSTGQVSRLPPQHVVTPSAIQPQNHRRTVRCRYEVGEDDFVEIMAHRTLFRTDDGTSPSHYDEAILAILQSLEVIP